VGVAGSTSAGSFFGTLKNEGKINLKNGGKTNFKKGGKIKIHFIFDKFQLWALATIQI
jgi:hypothetical protein